MILDAIKRFLECVSLGGHAFGEGSDQCVRCGAKRGAPSIADLIKRQARGASSRSEPS